MIKRKGFKYRKKGSFTKSNILVIYFYNIRGIFMIYASGVNMMTPLIPIGIGEIDGFSSISTNQYYYAVSPL